MPWPNESHAYVPDYNDEMHVSEEWTPDENIRLARVANNYLKRYMEQCWIDSDSDGFTGWRWVKYNVSLYIVSAANRYGDIIVVGPRHYSNTMQTAIDALGGTDNLRKYGGDDCVQGFIDQYGTFHDRKEAWVIAEARGQIRYPDVSPTGTLFSEHLY